MTGVSGVCAGGCIDDVFIGRFGVMDRQIYKKFAMWTKFVNFVVPMPRAVWQSMFNPKPLNNT